MARYFSYGSNMSVAAMALRCPASKPRGAAQLGGYRLGVMREGWLTIVADASAHVHGVLWDLARADIDALDRYEGVGERLYTKIKRTVISAGGPSRALIYLGANDGPGVARQAYLDDVIIAAREWRLPPESIAALQGLAGGAPCSGG